MKDADDPIPIWGISYRDVFQTLYRDLTPDWKALEERLSRAAPGDATQDAWRSYDQAQRRANEFLREWIRQGALDDPMIRDPSTGDILALDRDKWTSMGDFETGISDDHVGPGDIFQSGPNTVVSGARRPVFFDRNKFNNARSKITHITSADAARVTDTSLVKNKGGRPSEYAWEAVKPLVFQELTAHGKPGRNNKRYPSKAQLVEFVQIKLGKFDEHPADTTVLYHVNQWIEKFDKN
jgi:hypothetical protein